MEFKYMKNINPEIREKNYYEFLFRDMFKRLLIGKRLRGELLKLEQGEKYSLELYQHVFITLYKIKPKSKHDVTCTGGIYNKDKDIYHYISLTNDGEVYELEVEIPVHRYIESPRKIIYMDKNIANIYFLLEKDLLTWS